MTLLDPWSVLSTGFWLSFGAVSVLIAVAEQSPRWALATGIQAQGGLRARVQRCCRALALATHLQVVMTMVTIARTGLFVSTSVFRFTSGQCLGHSVGDLSGHPVGIVALGRDTVACA